MLDVITSKVREMYLEYPFPNAEYKTTPWYKHMLNFFQHVVPSGNKSFLDKARILEAGCGTGATIMQVAKSFPDSSILGTDLSPTSLEIAKKIKQNANLSNIEFKNANILTMNLQEKFDVILNIGVLHHLSDAEAGLKNLVNHLTTGGYLILWLYGAYGRFSLNLNQCLFKILFSKVPKLSKKVALTKTFLSIGPKELLECHIDEPTTTNEHNIKNNFLSSLKYAIEHESWLVDQFLHVHEKSFTIENILELLNKTGLKLTSWLGMDLMLANSVDDPEIAALFSSLTKIEQLMCIDLLNKPSYYLLAVQKTDCV
jgi:2-polyprenyl-3-methyl-5-hydroxy-6-metoxy-1,4-benzoquinol methylase